MARKKQAKGQVEGQPAVQARSTVEKRRKKKEKKPTGGRSLQDALDMTRREAGKQANNAKNTNKRQRSRPKPKPKPLQLSLHSRPPVSGYMTLQAAQLRPGAGVLEYSLLAETDTNNNDSQETQLSQETNFGDGYIAFDDLSENEESKDILKQFQNCEALLAKEIVLPDKVLSVPEAPAPWVVARTGLSVAQQLNMEVLDYFEYTQPLNEEICARNGLIDRMRGLVKRLWPKASLQVYGSQSTGLFLPQADIDLVVWTPRRDLLSKSKMYSLADNIRRRGWTRTVQVISRARVPIIKFCDSLSTINVDVSFEHEESLDAVDTVNNWLKELPAARPLIMVVKQLLRRHKLHEPAWGGLGGYAIVCMVVSFLNNHPKMKEQALDPEKNLGVLLLEFLEYYGQEFQSDQYALRMTGTMEIFPKFKSSFVAGLKPQLLAIEDPNNPDNNITQATTNYMTVRRTFSRAADLLRRVCADASVLSEEQRTQKSFLAAMLRVQPAQRQGPPETQAEIEERMEYQVQQRRVQSQADAARAKEAKEKEASEKQARERRERLMRAKPEFYSAESSQSENEDEDNDDEDSRVGVTSAERRSFWRSKGAVREEVA